jgi:hypothetical protein
MNHLTVGVGRPSASQTNIALSSTPTETFLGFVFHIGAAVLIKVMMILQFSRYIHDDRNIYICKYKFFLNTKDYQ